VSARRSRPRRSGFRERHRRYPNAARVRVARLRGAAQRADGDDREQPDREDR
jgi:hypothetical protein